MTLLIGIDEAGYGPLLGPMVVSAAALEIPSSLLPEDLWAILHKSVGKNKRSLRGRLLITDSKKAFTQKRNLSALSRTVLSILHSVHKNEEQLKYTDQMLKILCPESIDQLLDYPWYRNLSNCPLEPCEDLLLASSVFEKTLTEHHIRMICLSGRFLDVLEYNRRVEVVKNKSRVLFTELCALILECCKNYQGNEKIHVLVDRQGGRTNYRGELGRMFPEYSLAVIKQNKSVSSYELSNAHRTLRIHFITGADGKHLPVSLASMVSKFIRELLMLSLNQYFTNTCNLKPTAGYWQDGQRFITDLKNHPNGKSLEYNKLIRIC